MPGDKKGSDLASRLKRPSKLSSRSNKTSSTASPISAPPRAAIATSKAKKDDLYRRKNTLTEMLLPASSNEKDGSRPSTSRSLPGDEDRAFGTVARSVSSSGGNSHLDRIAELEKALAIAHREQQAKTNEIKNLKQHEVVYRDAMDVYKQQLSESSDVRQMSDSSSALKEFEQETDRHRFWSKERSELQEEIYELKDRLEELQAESVDREAIWSAQWEHERANWIKERNHQREALHNAEKDAQERRKQMLELKQSISALTRVEDQATDSDLTDRMDQLYHRIREWVISNFRRSKLDVSSPNEETAAVLEAINPKYKQSETADKISLYQAVVAFNAMVMFKENVCVGLPTLGPLSETRKLAESFQENEGPDFRDWRKSTIRMIEASPLRKTLEQGKQALVQTLAEKTLGIVEHISGVTKTDSIQSSLCNILAAAGDLQDTLLSQKARYSISFVFHEATNNAPRVDVQRMESINELEEDDGDLSDAEFRYCVFPALEKFGDEHGARPEIRNLLLKARVVCGTSVTPETSSAAV